MQLLTFGLFDRTLHLSVDHAEIENYLRRAFAPFLSTRRDDEDADRAEIAIFRPSPVARLNGEVLPMERRALQSPLHLAAAASSAIFQRWFLLHTAYSAWYAAGVNVGGHAVVISAPSGTGKTTLALELLRRGCTFYGDEFIFIRRSDRMVFPFRRSLLIREGTRRIFASAAALQQACEREPYLAGERGRSWHFIHARDLFGSAVEATPAPLGAAILLERGERTVSAPISSSVFALNAAPRVGYAAQELDRLGGMLGLLDGVHCLRLVAADVQSAAGELLGALSTAA